DLPVIRNIPFLSTVFGALTAIDYLAFAYNLSAFMDGDIQDCIDHLIVAENAERLKESEL
ncbi:MAG: hypothetical protein IKC78_07015, partial [Alistipes sp.]|nr:hypothetical protein [Alistipes sp.]